MNHKSLLYSIPLLFISFSCKKEIENKITIPEKRTEQKSSEESESKKNMQIINLAEYNKLVPVEIKKPGSKDIFKKYGIEFSGNCYACDLAVFRLNKKNFDIVNLCDKDDIYRLSDFNYEKKADTLKITTPGTNFIFIKIENEPIYQLKIEGKKPKLKNKRFSEFYTTENLLQKFEEHDCGDFGG